MDFRADNTDGCCLPLALAVENLGRDLRTNAPLQLEPYGLDTYTARMRKTLAKVFEIEHSEAHCVSSGTAGLLLGLKYLCPEGGVVLCSDSSFLLSDDLGAEEGNLGNIMLRTLGGRDGKIEPDNLILFLDNFKEEVAARIPYRQRARPIVLALSNATEKGTVYQIDELKRLCTIAHYFDLKVFVDGSRFANALITTGASPAGLSWVAGVDLMLLGMTKQGGLQCDILLSFEKSESLQSEHIIVPKSAVSVKQKYRNLSTSSEPPQPVAMREHRDAQLTSLEIKRGILPPSLMTNSNRSASSGHGHTSSAGNRSLPNLDVTSECEASSDYSAVSGLDLGFRSSFPSLSRFKLNSEGSRQSWAPTPRDGSSSNIHSKLISSNSIPFLHGWGFRERVGYFKSYPRLASYPRKLTALPLQLVGGKGAHNPESMISDSMRTEWEEDEVYPKRSLTRLHRLLKQAGQIGPKSWFPAYQCWSLLVNNNWLNSALLANQRALSLARTFEDLQIKIEYPVESNLVFVNFTARFDSMLKQAFGIKYQSRWSSCRGMKLCRFATSYCTPEESIEKFGEILTDLKEQKFLEAMMDLPTTLSAQSLALSSLDS